MDEKILIQYRCADDENFKRLKKLSIIPIILGFAIIALGFTMISSNEGMSLLCSAIGFLFSFPGVIANAVMKDHSKTSITVAEHRVYGRERRIEVNLPMDSISSISKEGKLSLVVASPSGKVVFFFYTSAKREEVFQIVSQQIFNRQNNKGSVTVVNNNSNADELKKYKDLLDAGIITQEEFDAKKKQLLGL